MAQYIPGRNTYAEIGEALGGGITHGYQTRSDEMAIQKAIESLGPKASHRDVLNALTNTRTHRPEAKQRAAENYLKSYGIDQDMIRQSMEDDRLKETKRHNEAVEKIQADKADAAADKEAKKPSYVDAILKKNNADKYSELSNDIMNFKYVKDDIKELRRVADDLSGVTGMGHALAGTGGSKYFEDIGLRNLDKVIKIFNPAGALAVSKFNQLKDAFLPKAREFRSTQEDKIKGLERLADQAYDRALTWSRLMEETDFNPSVDQLQQFKKESEGIIDLLLEERANNSDSSQSKSRPPLSELIPE